MVPGQKTSIGLKHGMKYYDDIYKKNFLNSTLMERYNESSYELGKDFNIILNSNHQNKIKLGEVHFKGDSSEEAVMPSGTFKLFELRTLAMAKCYTLLPLFDIESSFGIDFSIKMNPSVEPIDIPKGVHIFLTSNKTWANIADQMWPQVLTSSKYKSFGSTYSELMINLVEHYFKEGNDDIIGCLTDLAKKVDCPVKCHILSSVNLPLCNTSTDLRCMLWNTPVAEEADCYMAKKFNSYQIGRTDSTIFKKTSNLTLEFYMGMYSMMKQVKEEIEVISTPDLIGSVGGSLGMFFGMSITATCSFCLKKIFEKF